MTAQVEWATASRIWDENCDLQDAIAGVLESEGLEPGTPAWEKSLQAIMDAGRVRRARIEGPDDVYEAAVLVAGIPLPLKDEVVTKVRAETKERIVRDLAGLMHEELMDRLSGDA
ncbi:MAG: hypothetical protein Q7V61_05650 [Actinomycetota bacterium]|nr:hypothetical protein [Actinomycetota bacterium]